ncbi:heme biosynthesis protein HemY [Sulfitobacter donghicola]|uniref:Heme biosynthesis protein HemY n=1 Tax=Sulfitobacter donghicola DSW-25 = KCTC 12864 = JCM 14565 TaxID=1300350 RepID=A0A073IM14_9RHOB|nr:heme biosynthesis HemY N-terminal domain-containing protein [Sulfitobacter donghicola]KEJ90610.1 heme biosynthesis protein HemY [Sulfitobacter donghicola DSW-25 = KCTC 12864 = JCM 14565]KIN67859.1 HemY domain protein [Sulfitobacter donghicola DSW-25 = KCTC 12864 = JCM 14565]
MLWSLFKIILFVGVVGALAWGAGFLLEAEGGLQIRAFGQELNPGPLESVLLLVLLVFAVWVLLKLLALLFAFVKFLNGDETAISRYFDRNRERKGFNALSEGLMALASGEGSVALAKAAKADKYLNKPELTNLLTAQAAEMAGDTRKAEETYRKLVENEQTRFVGVRGIMKQKLAAGDDETALQLAEKAFAIKPKHQDTGDVLLRLQAEKEDWVGARKTLSTKLRNGQIPRDLHKRRDAVLALSAAQDILADDSSIEKRETAIEANRLSPDLIPAAVLAAQGYITQGKPRYATRVLKKAWEACPHPDLAAAFAAIAPDETPTARIKRFAALTKVQSDHPETKMLLAELNIANEDFPAARRALGDLVETDPDARSVTLMAAIERGEGASDSVVKGWLARAIVVPRGPQWVCSNCQQIHNEWKPICDNCSSFDTLEWKRPPHSEVASPTGTQMLPLIVGALEDNSDVENVAVSEEDVTIQDAEIIEAEATSEDSEEKDAK